MLWIFPFLFVSATTISAGSVASVGVSGAFLSFIGADEARTSVGSVWWSGPQMMIGLSAGLAGYLIERLVESVPGELGLEILLELECRIGLLSNVIELTSNPVISTDIAGASNG